MLHSGKCKECRKEEELILNKEKINENLSKVIGEREHITDGSPCWCEPKIENFSPLKKPK